MGFDNECIINIQSLAGEYFCPVCRLLVYPNEALQSQCTHLYCKPCLAYVVGTTRACPYDGYLVTEADSKPLVESNKVLADTIGKLAVHCLYHRSGCTWQGPLSDCISHCSSCTFGNSPVVCNRCSIQIVHRQVQEHAQSCPGVPSQVQQPTTVQDVVPSAPPPDPNQTAQTGAASHIPHGPTLGSVADVTQHPSSAPAQPIAQASAPTPEQWYQQQQQYQQYYQQYPGYDPYQQQYQQYYPYQQQQQPGQQYPLPQPIIQPQQSSVPPQMYSQQHQSQNQPPMQPQPQFPAQILPQPPLQPHQPMQAPFPLQNQKPAPVIHPHSHAQFPPQTQPYPQIQPQPVQHPQTQPPPQPQFPQNYLGIQQQPQYPTQQQPQPRPPSQPGQQQPIPNSQPLAQHPSALAVTGNQSYPQPHIQQLQQGGVQPHHGNMQVQGGSFQKPQHPSSIPVQVSQLSPQVRPQQQSALFPSIGQAQIPPAYLQMQQPNHPSQQRPTIQSGQQLQPQFSQQNPQNLPGQPPNMPLNQSQQQQHPIIRPQGPSQAYPQSQQDSLLPGLQHQQVPPNQLGVQSYPHVQSGHPPPGAPVRPVQPVVGQNTVNQNYAPRNNHFPPSSEQHIGYIQPDSQLDPPSTVKPPPIHDIQRNAVPTKGLPEDEADTSLKKSTMNHEVEKSTSQPVPNDAVSNVASSNVMKDSVQVQHSEADKNVDEKGSSYKSNNHIEKQDHAAVDHALGDKEKIIELQRKDSLSTKHDFIDANGKIQIEKHDGGLNPVQNEKETAVVVAPVSETGKNLAAPARDIPQIKGRNIAEANSSSFQGDSYRGFHSSADMQARGIQQPSHHHRAEIGPNNPHMARPNLAQQQRPVVPFIPQQTFPPGHPSQMQEFLPPPPPPPPLFPQGPGMVPLQGPPLAPEVLPQPSMNQPHGFPPEVPPGGMVGMPYSGQYGPAPNQYGPGERNIDPQLAATHSHGNFGQPNLGGKIPQGEYGVNHGVGTPVPGSFDPSAGMFPLRGPQNNMPHYRPNIPTESEIFSGQRPNLIDSRPPTVNAFGGSDHGPFDPRHMIQPPNFAKMNGFRGVDSPSALGIQNDRFNPPVENLNPFMVEPSGRAPDRRMFEEDLKLFPRYPESSRHGDGGNMSLRSFDRDHKGFHDEKPPFPIGSLHYPNDGGERIHHPGFHDDGRHRVDQRSPNRELSGIHSRGFRGFSGQSMNRIGRSDMDGRDSKSFSDIPKPFDLPPDHPGAIFGDNRYPPFSNVPHRGDHDIPTNFTHHRNSDAIGQDLISDHRHNISNQHHRFGDSSKFGAFPSMGHSQDELGSGNFSQMPFGDSIRTGNMPSHPRIGEPGFRSRYSLPAFPKDGGFHHGGDIDPLDNMRKRTQTRVGWCRICRVDCETVEGLDLHSQTGEHQKMAMDMVINIKLQNSKKIKTSNDSKVMNVGHDICNN